MGTDWKGLLGAAMQDMGALAKGNPKLMQAMETLDKAGAAHGALDAKTRELIALAVAATTRCDTCIAVHAKGAADAGASREELLETLAVAVGLNAGAAFVYSSHILSAFDTLGK
ncbi:carboxymuconolactone decarboxylase family protein [Solidesulfovibrio sp.]|uniref:carboxymuconolactone decarboxylase family protein n=1 Tax=Solidesulfovibrio sp. TaxID=2910990 RepID=UPI00260A5DE3|nr:carboxymuconolactone decarboxylase family protein [Solidesulfovibrio sp.]